MKKSQFLGITILNPGEGLDSDNFAFTGRDRELIDYGVRMGAKLHRHNGAVGMPDPTGTASASVTASGGAIPTGVTISVGYTYSDAQGGETRLSPTTAVTTGSPMSVPTVAPSVAIDYASGALLTNTYYYALSWLDGEGGETPVGPTASVDREPGFATAQVHLSNLNAGMATASASGWRLYRAAGGGAYEQLSEGGPGASTFTDDGTTSVDCDVHPVQDGTNKTRQNNVLHCKLPDGTLPEVAGSAAETAPVFINLYASLGNDFGESSLLAQYPLASANQTVSFPQLQFLPSSPPDVNTSFGGANKIDPDVELIDWHWKRPVEKVADLPTGAEGSLEGDVRMVTEEGRPYLFHEGAWAPLAGEGTAELLEDSGMGFIYCGEVLTKARPVGFACVTWMTKGKGEEAPEHMAEHDILISLP